MEFKFNVGDTVKHVITAGNRGSSRYFVLARCWYEEADGASGAFYQCRAVLAYGSVAEHLQQLYESELIASEPFSSPTWGTLVGESK